MSDELISVRKSDLEVLAIATAGHLLVNSSYQSEDENYRQLEAIDNVNAALGKPVLSELQGLVECRL